MQVRMVQNVMGEADITEGTEPTTVTVYEAPDSTDTRTECVEVPRWLNSIGRGKSFGSSLDSAASSTSGRVEKMPDSISMSGPKNPSLDSRDVSTARMALRSLPYVITPTTNGRPSLSVTSRTVTLSAFDPRDGSGLEYQWDVPEPTWSLNASARVTAGRAAGFGAADLLLTRHGDLGQVSIGPSAFAIVTEGGYEAGPGLTIRASTRLW